ncbi:hypothetical protein L210DRAFT_3648925 [Boletus edulis BED1]|uniref:Uncharacterized protein n=1 Tax=Boletus edulis BED1 TaxID=1328754 RepID=A0AAD4GBM7_BOLED|nr:hypothetical protein L210DRAFT_3648925 [Boletus edulis BED1]
MSDAPAAVAPDPSTSSPSEWHSIRPWTPHLTLAVREITSVSATFILSSSLDARHTTDDEPEEELAGDTSNDTDNDTILDSRGIISDAMSHGLSVDVNGSNWQRVILRMNDHADEAIIVIYGLHPGRQYDIDLALVSGGTMRKQVTTEDAESTILDNEPSDDLDAIATPETQTSNVNDCSPSVPSTCITPTPEERLRTLSHQLSTLHAEQASLQSALKTLRRDAHKTTTNLRGEIDVLKRASEKAGIAEYKARQRVRALEDAVRRANEGREEREQLTAADEQELPGLTERQSEAENVLRATKREADAVRTEREKREEEERKRKENMKGECATLNQKIERLTVKKERLESSVIPDLEAQVAEIQREIELAERGGFQNGDVWESLYGDSSRTDSQWRPLSHPGTTGRPLAQRASQPPISPPHFSRHQPRSQSVYRTSLDGASHPPGLAHASGLLHSSSSSISYSGSSGFNPTTPALSHSTNTIFSTQSPSSSLSRSTSSVGSSTLSSKAPPFEPTRNLRVSLSSPSASGAFPSGGLLSMNSQGSLSTATFPSTGSSSAFSLSTSYSSTQKLSQSSHKTHDTDIDDSQVRLGWPSVSRGSAGEDIK